MDWQICTTSNNPNCCKKLTVPAGTTLATCNSCQGRLLFKKASVELNEAVQLKASDEQSFSVTIFQSLVKSYMGKNT